MQLEKYDCSNRKLICHNVVITVSWAYKYTKGTFFKNKKSKRLTQLGNCPFKLPPETTNTICREKIPSKKVRYTKQQQSKYYSKKTIIFSQRRNGQPCWTSFIKYPLLILLALAFYRVGGKNSFTLSRGENHSLIQPKRPV